MPDESPKVKEKLDRIQETAEELEEMDFEQFSIYSDISNIKHRAKDLKKKIFTPEKPETCDGFITDCENKPSKYYDLKDKWLCIGCWNEMAEHYGS